MTEPVYLSNAEREAIETLAAHLPEPGTRCPTCHRRVNKKHKPDSPESKEVRLRGTAELVESVREKVDLLQEYSGADPYSYPGLRIVEAALVVAAQQREEFKRYFGGDE